MPPPGKATCPGWSSRVCARCSSSTSRSAGASGFTDAAGTSSSEPNSISTAARRTRSPGSTASSRQRGSGAGAVPARTAATRSIRSWRAVIAASSAIPSGFRRPGGFRPAASPAAPPGPGPARTSLKPRLAAERMTTVYETLERALVPSILAMEHAGIKVDRAILSRLSSSFAQRAVRLGRRNLRPRRSQVQSRISEATRRILVRQSEASRRQANEDQDSGKRAPTCSMTSPPTRSCTATPAASSIRCSNGGR